MTLNVVPKSSDDVLVVPISDSNPDVPGTGIYLYWIPLGAGGSGLVRFNGRVYERIGAWIERRSPLDLFHTALEVRLPEGRYVVETMWPSPDDEPQTRGVTVSGPVFTSWLSFTRVFRYEVRCWRDGMLPDAGEAVGGPQLVTTDEMRARHLLSLTIQVPPRTWGRDELGLGEMWNSNSVIAWLLARSGAPIETLTAPEGGRAPGWDAGLATARQRRSDRIH